VIKNDFSITCYNQHINVGLQYNFIYNVFSTNRQGWSKAEVYVVSVDTARSLISEYFFFLIRLVGCGVQLGPLGTAATDWPTVACPR
jgi:hypothetical protein